MKFSFICLQKMSWFPSRSSPDQMALSIYCSQVIAVTVLLEVQSLLHLWLAGTARLAPWSRPAGSGLTPAGGGVSGQQSARGEHSDAFSVELWLVREEGGCKTLPTSAEPVLCTRPLVLSTGSL